MDAITSEVIEALAEGVLLEDLLPHAPDDVIQELAQRLREANERLSYIDEIDV